MLTLYKMVMASEWGRKVLIFVSGAFALGLVISSFYIWLAVHDASVASKARTGYVTKVMLETVQGRLDEEHRQLLASDKALSDFKEAQAEDERGKKEANAKLNKAITEDTSAGCTWTADDIEWLRLH